MPDSAHNPARIAFIRHFKWDTVTTFSQNEEVHSLAVNDLVTKLERANISCSTTLSFSEVDYKEQLQMLRVIWTSLNVFLTQKFLMFIVYFLYSSWKDDFANFHKTRSQNS